MGSSSRTSYFGAPKNPWNTNKISGGSSGGSATTIAARDLPFALGSDTGGSIRQPAAYTGIVGMKPTYGRISRFGLVAFASSLDQIGPMTTNVYNNALLLNALVGKDEKDLTSVTKKSEDFTRLIGEDIKGMKIAVPNFFVSDIVNSEIITKLKETIELLKKLGATVEYIDMKYIDNAVTLYQIIAMGEASSNLARFDGIRYGYSAITKPWRPSCTASSNSSSPKTQSSTSSPTMTTTSRRPTSRLPTLTSRRTYPSTRRSRSCDCMPLPRCCLAAAISSSWPLYLASTVSATPTTSPVTSSISTRG